MHKPLSIAIDGPASSGKSTLAKQLAVKFSLNYVDTGAMYRAITVKLLRHKVSLEDRCEIAEVLKKTEIDFHDNTIYLDGCDVSAEIRTPFISENVSKVSSLPVVRSFLFTIQKTLAEKGNVIMDGRDIGTVIMPNASLKIFLTATPETRAKRRFQEYREKGIETSYEEILSEVLKRDKRDSERELAPLKKAEDALEVDTSKMDIPEMVEFVSQKIQALKG